MGNKILPDAPETFERYKNPPLAVLPVATKFLSE
jgi:hypothetical protein